MKLIIELEHGLSIQQMSEQDLLVITQTARKNPDKTEIHMTHGVALELKGLLNEIDFGDDFN